MTEEHPVGLTRDAGFQIGVSRTLPHPPEAVWDLLTSPEGAALWLGPGADLTGRVGGPVTAADGSAASCAAGTPVPGSGSPGSPRAGPAPPPCR